MISASASRKTSLAFATCVAVLSVACADVQSPSMQSPTSPGDTQASAEATSPGDTQASAEAVAVQAVTRQAERRLFEICKDFASGPGQSVTFDVQVDDANDGSIDSTFQVTLAPGACADVHQESGTPNDRVIVTEQVPSGFTVSFVQTRIIGVSVTTFPPVQGNTASGLVGDDVGHLVVFTNTPIPPPQGGQGCTPGYWKQSQHFDSWTPPYDPTDLFSSVFEDAFPGKTLLDVLKLGGGGLNALGRHTVAALLNAASPGVSYNLSVADVINQFNAVFPGGDYQALKNTFEAFNQQGCPLN